MNKLVRITNALHGTAFASVVVGDGLIKVFPASPDAEEWSIWAQEQCKTLDEINDSLGYAYQSELPVPVTEENQLLIKSLIGDSQISDVMDFASESSLELIHSFGTNVRRFAVKNLPSDEYSVTSMGIREFVPSSRQLVIDYKAMSFLSESTYSDVSYHVKKARALWDPDLGPGGGWRCPPGTQFGGYITDRWY